MFRNRRQTINLRDRAVRAAGRTISAAGRMAYRTGQSVYRRAGMNTPRSVQYVAKTAARAAVAGSVGRLAYNTGKRTIRSMGLTYTGGNDYSKNSQRVGRNKKPTVNRLNKLIKAAQNKQIYRFQNITNFDTNVGAMSLGNWQYTTGQVQMPLHAYDLTSFNNIGVYRPGMYFQWASTAPNATVIRGYLNGQAADGTPNAGAWQIETKGGVNPSTSFPNSKAFVHEWSDIRLLLYGARKRTTRFDVMFFRCPDEYSNLGNAGTDNVDLKELLQYIERPAIYNPIQTLTENHISKKMKMVKKFTYYISAGQTTDVDTSVGKTKEVRIFMRHGRVYNLDYKHWTGDNPNHVLPHEQVDGLDYVSDTTHHDHPWYSSQLFMVIRAFAPERVMGKTEYPSDADANIDPSYDIIVRNCVSTPT